VYVVSASLCLSALSAGGSVTVRVVVRASSANADSADRHSEAETTETTARLRRRRRTISRLRART
jgi:hypothetical protein